MAHPNETHIEPTTLADWQAIYRRHAAALAERDRAQLSEALADTYREIDADGCELTREEAEERWLFRVGDPKLLDRVAFEIDRVEPDGERVHVTARLLVVRSERDWLEPRVLNGVLHEFHVEDTWRRVPGRWLLEERRHANPAVSGVRVSAEPSVDSPRLARLAADLDRGDTRALDAFWAEVAGRTPLVEPVDGDASHCQVTFVWRDAGTLRDVTVGGDLPHPEPERPLLRLGTSDVLHRTVLLHRASRCSYWFTGSARAHAETGEAYRLELADPLNPRCSGATSWFELPDAPAQPYLVRRRGVPRGSLVRAHLASRILGERRPYSIHLPAGVAADTGAGLLVLFDGEVYGSAADASIPAPATVDNLVADGLLPPIATLLVDNIDGMRSRDLTCHPPFFEFLTRELIPEVRAEHGLSADPARTVAGGSSFGGLAAAYAGLRHADTIGNVLSQSGSFWYVPAWQDAVRLPHETESGWMMAEFMASPRQPVRFWMEVGLLDGPRTVYTNRHLRSVLELKGYDVTYSEFSGGHSSVCWRGSLADGLVSLLGQPHPSTATPSRGSLPGAAAEAAVEHP